MSVEATNWVLRHSKTRQGARLVMLALADYADKGGFSWPGVAALAADANLTGRAVQAAIKRIVKLGELEREPRWDATGRQMSNGYRFTALKRLGEGEVSSPRGEASFRGEGEDCDIALKEDPPVRTVNPPYPPRGDGRKAAREARKREAEQAALAAEVARIKAHKPYRSPMADGQREPS